MASAAKVSAEESLIVLAEAVVALALADAALERFGGATILELAASVAAHREHCRER